MKPLLTLYDRLLGLENFLAAASVFAAWEGFWFRFETPLMVFQVQYRKSVASSWALLNLLGYLGKSFVWRLRMMYTM